MKKIVLLLLLVSTKSVFAQGDREITYGLFAGGIYSKMSGLPDMIVQDGLYKNFTLKEEGKFGGTGGFFINWKYPYSNISIQTEVSYSGQSTDLNYQDKEGLAYKMTFAYSYINVGAQFKYYPVERFYIGAGPYVAFNIASDNLKYSSNAQQLFGDSGAYFEPDANVEKVLQESFTGKNYFYGMLAAGYEFNSGLSVSARYALGLTDAVLTEENGHRYSEYKNKINSISLIIGYSFDFDDLGNF
ncbi:MAG: PorT family protein [Chryseobacterium sp.]|nr:MAG: PorT family protein [Chryseobacterium sp.]